MASPEDARPAPSGDRRKPVRDTRPTPSSERPKPPRAAYYMIAPAGLGVTGLGVTGQTLTEQLGRLGDIEILQTCPQRDTSPPIAVARMSDATAAVLRRSSAGSLIIEP